MLMFRPHAAYIALVCLVTAAAACAVHATPPGDQPPPSFGAATPVDQLQDMTGGTDTHVTNNNLTKQESNGTVDNNTNFSIGNGANNMGDAALSGTGIITGIQNSGNNVLIQNNTIVTVRMQ
ncbi:hypothetical protein ABIE56_003021 [Luteibacter sp. 621]|jgi:hypothetical protein|uniref:hypothetical protein n=1 Tax=Luteibacter sp. 621 TaxID=3373916 RepID=UPI003D1DD598